MVWKTSAGPIGSCSGPIKTPLNIRRQEGQAYQISYPETHTPTLWPPTPLATFVHIFFVKVNHDEVNPLNRENMFNKFQGHAIPSREECLWMDPQISDDSSFGRRHQKRHLLCKFFCSTKSKKFPFFRQQVHNFYQDWSLKLDRFTFLNSYF